MNNLPVLRLTQLLTPEEMDLVRGVKATHEVVFSPIGVRMPHESSISRQIRAYDEDFGEEHYTPLAE